MKQLLLSFFYRKSKIYKFLFLVVILFLSAGIYFVLTHLQSFEAPTGMISNEKNQVIVEVQTENPNMQAEMLQRFVVGTPVYQLEEDLLLVGYIANVTQNEELLTFKLQIKKEFQESIFFRETKYSFLQTSPSLMMVLKKFFNDKNVSEKMQKDFETLVGKQKYLLKNITARIQDKLSRNIDTAKVNEMYTDPFIRERVWKALEETIVYTIDWDMVTENIQQHESTKVILNTVGDHIYSSRLAWEGTKGIFGDGFVANISKELLRQGSDMVRLEEARKVLLSRGQDVAAQTIEDTQISEKSYNFLLAIKKDKELYEYVKKKYGEPVWEILLESFEESMNNEKDSINTMKASVQTFAKKWLEFIMLNNEKDAPNPVMLLAVKEAVSGKKPLVMCEPVTGEKITAGYTYKLSLPKE